MAVDPNIKKKADGIRNKIYGIEVRESLASGLEAMSSDVVENEGRQSIVEGRQDSVESQWQAVSDEMTDKDVISAPEIIAARDGEANLKARLDKEKNEAAAQLAETDNDISSRGINIFNYKHLVPNIDELEDFSEGDWTQALQTAMDDLPDIGGTIFIPTNIGVENTVIFPPISNSQSDLKPITLKGVSESRPSGNFGGHYGGLSAIEFRGEGSLFDLRLGEEESTNGGVGFIDIALHGNNTPNTIGINAHNLIGSKFDNVLVRRFGTGLIAKDIFYSIFENFRAFYNIDYGVYINGYVNGTKFHRCSFSNTVEGSGFYSNYAGVALDFDGCWFESNEKALHIASTEQIAFNGCYFERNNTTFHVNTHEESGATQVSFNDCSLTISSNSEYAIRPNGEVNILMTNNRINWLLPITKPFIEPIEQSLEGSSTLISLNNEWLNKPTNLITRNVGTVLVNIDRHVEIGSDIDFKTSNTGLQWLIGNNVTTANLIDFPEITTANASARMFRNTKTEGALTFDIYKGDGSAVYTHRFDAQTGNLYIRGELGVGNSEEGQVDDTTPTKKVEIFNTFGISLGFVQVYEG